MTYTMIEGNQAHTSGPMGTVDLIVVHATVSPCKTGGARGNAAYFQSAGAGGLAHFIVDPGEVIQACKETVACWHAPPVNKRGIGVEFCDPQAGKDARWLDANHQKMLSLGAALFVDLCTRHNVPMHYVDAAALLRGERGITTHHDVSLAWGKSDHVDPGPGFPMGQFIQLVNGHKATPTTPEEPVTDAEIEKIAQRVKQLVAQDLAVILHGTKDGNHPANLDNIYAAVKK